MVAYEGFRREQPRIPHTSSFGKPKEIYEPQKDNDTESDDEKSDDEQDADELNTKQSTGYHPMDLVAPLPPATSCYWSLSDQKSPRKTATCPILLRFLYKNVDALEYLQALEKVIDNSAKDKVVFLEDLAKALRQKHGYFCEKTIARQWEDDCENAFRNKRGESVRVRFPFF
jgi:hypothetical protein